MTIFNSIDGAEPVTLISKMINKNRGDNRAPKKNSPQIPIKMSRIFFRLSQSCLTGQFLPADNLNKDDREGTEKEMCEKYQQRTNWTAENKASCIETLKELMEVYYSTFRKLIATLDLPEAIKKSNLLMVQPFGGFHFLALTGHSLNDFETNFTEKCPQLVKYFAELKNRPKEIDRIMQEPTQDDLKCLKLLAYHFNEKVESIVEIVSSNTN